MAWHIPHLHIFCLHHFFFLFWITLFKAWFRYFNGEFLYTTVSNIFPLPMFKNASSYFYSFWHTEDDEDVGATIDKMLLKYEYPVQKFDVTTEDGYILGVFRIPFSQKSPLEPNKPKKAVYLNHGMGGNGFQWLIQAERKNLAMLLADNGFDVFIGNARGTSYSQRHVDPKMTPKTTKFWEFSFHEMGVYDLPAVIDKITEITGHAKIFYIGHSLGTTQVAILLTERPEYNDRLETVFFLAPAIYLGNTNMFTKAWSYTASTQRYFFNRILGGKVKPLMKRGHLSRLFGTGCDPCGNWMFSLCGYDPSQMNFKTLSLFFNAFPEPVATKLLVHLSQLIKSHRFSKYDYRCDRNYTKNREVYGQDHPPNYNLSNITAPIVIYWGENDVLDVPQDVARVWRDLPPEAAKEFNRVNWDSWTHMDFALGKDADRLVYIPVMNTMMESVYE